MDVDQKRCCAVEGVEEIQTSYLLMTRLKVSGGIAEPLSMKEWFGLQLSQWSAETPRGLLGPQVVEGIDQFPSARLVSKAEASRNWR